MKSKNALLVFVFWIGFVVILLLVDLVSLSKRGDEVLGRIFFSTGYKELGSSEICPAIISTEKANGYTKLIIGDSVCHQVFNGFQEENADYLFLGTNQAITIDGQYILAKSFIVNHENVSDIYLIVLPTSFKGDSCSELSYSYLVEPFGKMGKLDYLSEDTIKRMKDYYGSIFLKKSIIRFVDGSSINNKLFLFHNQKKHSNEISSYKALSDEARFYIIRLWEECENEGIEFHILSSPICRSLANEASIDELYGEIRNTDLEPIFEKYFLSISYYPQELFSDGIHFKQEYATKDNLKTYIYDLQKKSGELEGLLVE